MRKMLIITLLFIIVLFTYEKASQHKIVLSNKAVETQQDSAVISQETNATTLSTKIDRQPAIEQIPDIPKQDPVEPTVQTSEQEASRHQKKQFIFCQTKIYNCANADYRRDFYEMVQNAYKENYNREVEERLLVRCPVEKESDCADDHVASVQSFTEDELNYIHSASMIWLETDIKFDQKDEAYLKKFMQIESMSLEKPEGDNPEVFNDAGN